MLYRAHLQDRKLSPATINRRLAALRSLVKLARTLGLVTWGLEVEGLRSQAALATSRAEKDKEAFQAEYPIKSLKFDYAFEKEKKPFMVSAIYHDDKFTYIRSSAEEKPTLYEVKDGSPNLINFDLKDGVYVVPKILDSGYLVIGKHRLDFRKQG